MTIQDAIAAVDELTPNAYSAQQKLAWLSTLDGKIWHELYQSRRTPPGCAFYPPEGYDSDEYELLAPAPYAADLYGSYLQARIAEQNGEPAKYSQYAALFNRAYGDFAAWFNRSHRPGPSGRWRF